MCQPILVRQGRGFKKVRHKMIKLYGSVMGQLEMYTGRFANHTARESFWKLRKLGHFLCGLWSGRLESGSGWRPTLKENERGSRHEWLKIVDDIRPTIRRREVRIMKALPNSAPRPR